MILQKVFIFQGYYAWEVSNNKYHLKKEINALRISIRCYKMANRALGRFEV